VEQPVISSVLVIRLSAIGDIVMASPLIAALRERYPQAHIAWLVQPEAYDLLAANEQLDEVIVWPRGEWHQLWRKRRWWTLLRVMGAFVRQLRRRRFDLVLDAQGLLKSGIWAWFSGARQRIGLGSREGSARMMTRVIDKPQDDVRIGSEYRELARQLGLKTDNFRMQIALSSSDRVFGREFVQQHGLEQGYVVACPFTTRPQKHWVEQRWPELAEQIYGQLGLPLVVLGGPGDKPVAERMMAGQAQMINVVGQTRLRQAAALIAGARLLIGVDTGLTHMGIAAAIPTITIFGSTCPYLNAGRDTGQDNTAVLYKALDCSPCRRNPTCDGAFTCMADISVAEVMQTAQQLLVRPDTLMPTGESL